MPMAGSAGTPTGNGGGGSNAATGGGGATPAAVAVGSNKTWELSDYELHRTPQDAITDASEIAVSPRALHSELMCPICLDMLHETMTTKECLHRFCAECIITALRSGNKECPTCRKKLVSKRSLRRDPNFDMLISKIYPSRDEYEAQQQKAMARLSKSHNQLALATSIEEGMKAQEKHRKILKPQRQCPTPGGPGTEGNNAEGDNGTGTTTPGTGVTATATPTTTTGTSTQPTITATGGAGGPAPPTGGPSEPTASHTGGVGSLEGSSAPPPVPLSGPSGVPGSTNGVGAAVMPGPSGAILPPPPAKTVSRTDSVGGDNSSNTSDEVTEVELVFKPHPDMAPTPPATTVPSSLPPEQLQTRFIKTSANATVDHLRKYLGMRLALDSETGETEELNCTIWIAPNGNFIKIPSGLTLGQICDKYWRFNKPLEVFYCWRKV